MGPFSESTASAGAFRMSAAFLERAAGAAVPDDTLETTTAASLVVLAWRRARLDTGAASNTEDAT